MRFQGVRTSKERVLRLMRENQLLSPARMAEPVRSNPHEGTIVAEAPNQMWGTDATATFTDHDGTVTIFAAIDHCSADCVGIARQLRAAVNSPLNYLSRHDSMNQLTPSDLSNLPGSKHQQLNANQN